MILLARGRKCGDLGAIGPATPEPLSEGLPRRGDRNPQAVRPVQHSEPRAHPLQRLTARKTAWELIFRGFMGRKIGSPQSEIYGFVAPGASGQSCSQAFSDRVPRTPAPQMREHPPVRHRSDSPEHPSKQCTHATGWLRFEMISGRAASAGLGRAPSGSSGRTKPAAAPWFGDAVRRTGPESQNRRRGTDRANLSVHQAINRAASKLRIRSSLQCPASLGKVEIPRNREQRVAHGFQIQSPASVHARFGTTPS